MNIYNNGFTRRINNILRKKYTAKIKKKLTKSNITVLCNNCTGGFILHDLGLKFNTPTINMFFPGLDFFDFVEHFDYYINRPLVQKESPLSGNDVPHYPVATINGGEFKDIDLHFMHYKSFEEAKSKWEDRKKRIIPESIYVIWSFVGMEEDSAIYERAQNLPVKNKVFFVNHQTDKNKYPDFFYIKGFESNTGLGLISEYMNLKGERYYDQFDYVKWINNG